MKITDRTTVQDPRVGAGSAPVDSPAPRGSDEAVTAGGRDRVEVSETARRLAELVANAADDPTQRARVEALRAAVADGTYRADVEETARRFLIEVASEARAKE